jgi:hypothetical protein
MKLITSLSISALVFMPAIAFAGNSPSSTGTGSTSNQAGQKFYPDWAAVKKIAAPSSQNAASVKPDEAISQQKPESMSTNGNSSDSAKDQPGLMEKAQEKAKDLLGAKANSSANDQPGLMEKAKDLMGTITGRSVSSNESDSPSSTGTISQPNQERASNTGGQKSYPDWAAVKKTAPPSQKE